jgi:transcriptional regulator with XRE-family HTH domain
MSATQSTAAHPRRAVKPVRGATRAAPTDKHIRARRADLRDEEVGRRVRSRRLESRLSQTELADKIGVTFQQVQKYEKGVNRIGAGRLQRISEALEVPISFFFGTSAEGGSVASGRSPSNAESVFGFLQTSGSVRLVKAFHQIRSRKARQLIVEMAEQFAAIEASQ